MSMSVLPQDDTDHLELKLEKAVNHYAGARIPSTEQELIILPISPGTIINFKTVYIDEF